jgi:cell division protein WhiA
MALTASVKEELAQVRGRSTAENKAEASAMLRFGGGLRIIGGQLIVEADLDQAVAARRLRTMLSELYGHDSEIIVTAGGSQHRAGHYVVRSTGQATALARQAGLLDARGRPIHGLASTLVTGTTAQAQALWRGAFLVRGTLTGPGPSAALEVTCPSPEAALALAGVARRLGVTAKTGESRGVHRVVLRRADAITAVLDQMGAARSARLWQKRQARPPARPAPARSVAFSNINQIRSTRAAAAAGARIERALAILGEDTPEHLRHAGELRIKHHQASLDELGRLAEPPLSKDAIAGRIRRLLVMADQRAHRQGIPDTQAALLRSDSGDEDQPVPGPTTEAGGTPSRCDR